MGEKGLMKTSGKTGARKNGGIGACARRLYLFCFPFLCVQFFFKTRKKRSELPWDSNSVEISLLSRQWAFFPKWSTTTTRYWRALKTKMTKRLVIATLKKKNHIDSMHTPGRVQYKAYVTLNITGRGQRADFFVEWQSNFPLTWLYEIFRKFNKSNRGCLLSNFIDYCYCHLIGVIQIPASTNQKWTAYQLKGV